MRRAPTIELDEEHQRFVAVVDGQVCELAFRKLRDGRLELFHTFVPPPLRGQKVAEHLVQFALDYARAQKMKVVATCWYVKQFMERNSTYQDLL